MTKDNDCRELKPRIQEFKINPVGGADIEVEGNKWFCHSHEVEVYKAAHEAQQEHLCAALEVARGALEWIVGYDGNQHTTNKAEQALTTINKILKGGE